MSLSVIIPSVKCVFVGCLVVVNCKNLSRVVTSSVKYYTPNLFNVSNVKFSCQKRREPPWRIIYFGTDDFSLACLQPLNAKLNTGTLLSGLGVVSQPNSDLHKYAVSERLPIHDWPPDDEVLSNYDMGIVVSYGKLIPERIINGLPLGVLNVHGSLLPRWRGAAPIAFAVMHGDVETGVSIMRIKPHKFDIGDIVRQYRCSISPDETTTELRSKLAKHAGILLMDCIRDLPRCLDMATPQSSEGVSYAPKITAKLCKVDWNKLSAKQVYDLYRAIEHKYGLATNWFDKNIKLYGITLDKESKSLAERKRSTINQGASLSHKSALDFLHSNSTPDLDKINYTNEDSINTTPGLVSYDRRRALLKIQCADGKHVLCSNFKTAAGRMMSAVDFYNGYLSKRDKKDWYFK